MFGPAEARFYSRRAATLYRAVGVFECEFKLGGLLPALSMETMDAESLVTKSETPNPVVTCAKRAGC